MMGNYKSDLVVILEPRCSGVRARVMIRKLGFSHHIISEARDFSGGV